MVPSEISASILVCPRSWARECRVLSRNIFCMFVLSGVYAGAIFLIVTGFTLREKKASALQILSIRAD